MNLKQLRHVLVLARSGNFSRAAEELGVQQPVLSRSIKAIERQYGVRLFDRGRFGAKLTPRGLSVIGEISSIIDLYDALHEDLLARERRHNEQIAIGAAPLPAAILLPQAISAMIAERPGMRIDAEVLAVEQLISLLREGTIEFALCLEHTVPTISGVRTERVATTQTGSIVRKGHPLLGHQPVSPRDITRFPTVASASESPTYAPAISCNSYQIQKEIVRSSDAIWFGSLAMIRDEDELVALEVSGPELEPRHISVTTSTERPLSPGGSAMIAKFKEISPA